MVSPLFLFGCHTERNKSMDSIFQTDPDYPQVTEGLLRHLEDTFPMKGFRNVRGEEQLYRYQGAQDVIDHLRSIFEFQNRET